MFVSSFLRYPADASTQAKINSILDWHHSNLRVGGGAIIFLKYPVACDELRSLDNIYSPLFMGSIAFDCFNLRMKQKSFR